MIEICVNNRYNRNIETRQVFDVKKKTVISVIAAAAVALAVIVFLASCIAIEDVDNGILLSGYALRDGENYYLMYSRGSTELTVGHKKNHTVTFGTYGKADTSEVESFLEAAEAARRECVELHPEYEGSEITDEKNNAVIYTMPKNAKIDEFMNEKIGFAGSAFSSFNETKREFKDAAGNTVEACEVPGTDGKVIYLPSNNCRDVLFYVLASEVNSGLKDKTWNEFYEECTDKINPSKVTFKFPWER